MTVTPDHRLRRAVAACRLALLAAPFLLPATPAAAQPVIAPPGGTQPGAAQPGTSQPALQNALIRAWPDAGAWRVLLVRTRALDGAPACLLMTGYASAATPGYRVWGLREGGGKVWLIMNTRQDLPATEISLFANGRRVVGVPVTERPVALGNVSTVVSLIEDVQTQALILDALHAAGTLGLSAGTVAATETIDPAAIRNFDECRRGGAVG